MTNHPSVQKRIDSLKAGIEHYTERKVLTIEVVEDPKVSYTFGIRCTLEGLSYPLDMLIVGSNLDTSIANTPADTLAEHLQECDFKEWPPKSGSLKFF